MKKFTKTVAVLMTCLTIALVLTACIPSGATNAAEKMSNAGYRVTINSDPSEKGATSKIIAIKGKDSLTAIWYETANLAQESKEEAQTVLGKAYILKVDGKCFYYGTEQGIKDFEA